MMTEERLISVLYEDLGIVDGSRASKHTTLSNCSPSRYTKLVILPLTVAILNFYYTTFTDSIVLFLRCILYLVSLLDLKQILDYFSLNWIQPDFCSILALTIITFGFIFYEKKTTKRVGGYIFIKVTVCVCVCYLRRFPRLKSARLCWGFMSRAFL